MYVLCFYRMLSCPEKLYVGYNLNVKRFMIMKNINSTLQVRDKV